MTTSTAVSVVTPERYASGIGTFRNWMSAIAQNHEYFQRHYDAYQQSTEDVYFFKMHSLNHGLKAMVLGED